MTMDICWRPRPADEISSPSDLRGVSLKKIAPQRPTGLWEEETLNSCHHSSHHKSFPSQVSQEPSSPWRLDREKMSTSAAPWSARLQDACALWKATPVVDVRKGRADCLKVV